MEKIARASDGKWIAGVCKGIANSIGINPLALRVLFVAVLFIPVANIIAVVAYVLAIFILPVEEENELESAQYSDESNSSVQNDVVEQDDDSTETGETEEENNNTMDVHIYRFHRRDPERKLDFELFGYERVHTTKDLLNPTFIMDSPIPCLAPAKGYFLKAGDILLCDFEIEARLVGIYEVEDKILEASEVKNFLPDAPLLLYQGKHYHQLKFITEVSLNFFIHNDFWAFCAQIPEGKYQSDVDPTAIYRILLQKMAQVSVISNRAIQNAFDTAIDYFAKRLS